MLSSYKIAEGLYPTQEGFDTQKNTDLTINL